ncbi:hypothetical protein ACW5F0_05755 [Luteimonas sp. A534]
MESTATRDPARHKAALVHLAASIAAIGAVLAVPVFFWYPGALLPLSGIDRHLVLLFAAVLAAGPVLTWLVYRSSKRRLRMDIAVVVLIQLLFLAYAIAMLARLRPVYLVGMGNHIELVRALDIDPADLARTPEAKRALSWTGPILVGALPPGGLALSGADDYARRPAYHIDYAHVGPMLAQRGRTPEELIARSHAHAEALGVALAAVDRESTAIRVVPLVSQAGHAAMLVDAIHGRPLRPAAVKM